MKAFNKIVPPRLSQLVASELEEAIISGALEPRNRLPSEQELAKQFGVSRNLIREALKIVEERGLVEIISGSGTFVCEPSSEPTTDALERYIRFVAPDSSPQALFEARRILEGANARLAAERADAQDLETLRACLARMEQHVDSIERWTEADLDFHLAVARSTHNPFLRVLLEPLVGHLRSVIARGTVVSPPARTGLAPHFRLFDCIQNRDPQGAYAAMVEHISEAEAFQRFPDQSGATQS